MLPCGELPGGRWRAGTQGEWLQRSTIELQLVRYLALWCRSCLARMLLLECWAAASLGPKPIFSLCCFSSLSFVISFSTVVRIWLGRQAEHQLTCQEFFPFVKTLKEERPAAKSKAS